MQRTVALDSTQISSYLTCPMKWNLAHREHLQLADVSTDYFTKGSFFHKLLEFYYAAKIDGKKTPFEAAQIAVENII